MNGILLVNKPQGMTSHDVVNKIRKLTHEKKVGHTGTLDPNASGLLVLCIGEATKLIPYLENSNKVYEGTFTFGLETDTNDIEGNIIDQKNINSLKLQDLKNVIKNYTGKIKQIPPIYSAKKVNGRKLYQYARKNEDVEIKPADVEIYNIEIVDNSKFPQEVKFLIDCSKGTYIRSLARDIGYDLDNFAFLKELKRYKTNNYTLENSYTLEELESKESIKEYLLPIETALSFLQPVLVKEDSKSFLINGNKLYEKNIESNLDTFSIGDTVTLFVNNNLNGIGIIKEENNSKYIQPKRILKNE